MAELETKPLVELPAQRAEEKRIEYQFICWEESNHDYSITTSGGKS
jgi:hypothetical protein